MTEFFIFVLSFYWKQIGLGSVQDQNEETLILPSLVQQIKIILSTQLNYGYLCIMGARDQLDVKKEKNHRSSRGSQIIFTSQGS